MHQVQLESDYIAKCTHAHHYINVWSSEVWIESRAHGLTNFKCTRLHTHAPIRSCNMSYTSIHTTTYKTLQWRFASYISLILMQCTTFFTFFFAFLFAYWYALSIKLAIGKTLTITIYISTGRYTWTDWASFACICDDLRS